MAKHTPMAMDGYGRVKPLTEGYVVKGGVNTTTRITTRPPPPAPMRPAATSTPTVAKPTR